MQRVEALQLSLHLHDQTHFKQRIKPLDNGVMMLTLELAKRLHMDLKMMKKTAMYRQQKKQFGKWKRYNSNILPARKR